MRTSLLLALAAPATLALAAAPPQPSGEWPTLGRTASRNPVSPEKNPPLHWRVEKRNQKGEVELPARNVRWSARLGSANFAGVAVAGGLVWAGTNNTRPRDPRNKGDAGVLMCFRESDGEFLWQYVSPRIAGDRDKDWPEAGITCAPLIEGDRLYFTTNRAEVVCLDIAPLKAGKGAPKVVWKLDLIGKLGVSPVGAPMGYGSTCSIPPSYRGRIYVTTGNGRSMAAGKVLAPKAPSLVCLEAASGKVLWQDASPGEGILYAQDSSPLVVEVKGRAQVIVGQGDGWVRSFDALSGKLIWKFDTNPKDATFTDNAASRRNYIVATPVYHDGRVYVGNGRHPEHRNGPGRLWCIDPTRTGDVSPELEEKPGKGKPNPNSAGLWRFESWKDEEGELVDDRMRTMSSVAAQDGLVIFPTLAGDVHCLDAKTGKRHWTHEGDDNIYASPLIIDGRAYVADRKGVTVFALSRRKTILAANPMGTAGLRAAAPVYANGVLYLASPWMLHAVRGDADARHAGHWPQWRGPDRRNVSKEQGLLDAWPKDGPPLAWTAAGVGEGVGTVAVAGGRVYLLGHRDRYECLTALDEDTGKPLWSVPLGLSAKELLNMRYLSQRTPLVDGERVYAVTARGELVCARSATGKVLWRKDYAADFDGRRGAFGWCDQLLVDGDRLVGVPGGKTATVVALDKETGAAVWKCALGDGAQYVGAVLVEGGDGVPRHYVAVTNGGLVGVSTEGKRLWQDRTFANTTANSGTPNVIGNFVFSAGNYGRGVVLLGLKKSGDGVEAKQVYRQHLRTPAWHEMAVCVGDHAYVGTQAGVCCLEWRTGKVRWQEAREGGGLATQCSGTAADGHLYLCSQRGQAALVEANPEKFVLKGKFSLPDAKAKPGATAPVVAGGRLYLREDERLFCYDVRRGAKPGRAVAHTVPPRADAADLPKKAGKEEPDAIFVPTPPEVVEKMLELAKVRKTDTVVDLGCGDGRIVVAAARKYGCKAVGYEIDPECVKMARERVKEQKVGALVRIEEKNLFEADLAKVEVAALYLPAPLLKKLLPQLRKMPDGARIVSHGFAIPGKKPDRVVKVASQETGIDHTVYLYTLPLKEEEQ